jgi:membrane protease YdiL (CAAX protease family)
VRLLPSRPLGLLWLFLGPGLVMICFFVVFPMLALRGSPPAWQWHGGVLWGILVPMFNYNLFAGPLFEEFGWRGFLQASLQDLLPPSLAAATVGAMWAGWHLPLFLLKGWSSASPAAYLLIVASLAVIMALAFNVLGPYLDGNTVREWPSGEWLIGASFLLTAALLLVVTRGRLAAGRPHPSQQPALTH